MYENDLIYGKDKTLNVVSVEITENRAELFIQQLDGSVISEYRDYNYWLMLQDKPNKSHIKFAGSNPYKYFTEFEAKSEFYNAINFCKKRDKKVYANFNVKDQFLIRTGVTYFKGLNPKAITILSFDIETNGLAKNSNSQVYLITNSLRKNGEIKRVLFNIEDYDNQTDMILDWCDWVRHEDPTLLIGHNILMYDIPFLVHCMDLVGEELILGRNDSPIEVKRNPSKMRKDGSQSYDFNDVLIYGREVIDTMFLSLKYDVGRKYESYALKAIIKHEKLEKPGRTFIDAAEIRQYYSNRSVDPTMWQKTVQYAIEDSDDALKLFDLMIPAFFYQNQSVPVCFQNMINKATGSQINSYMIRAYIQNNESIPEASEVSHYEGALVAGVPGLHKNCFKVDVASLYPSIIRQYQVTIKNKDPHNYFLKSIEYFTEERLQNKQLFKQTQNAYYDDMQSSQKNFINSGYGFLGAQGLNFNYPEGAAFITRKGREILIKSIIFATGKDDQYWIDKSHGIEDTVEDTDELNDECA